MGRPRRHALHRRRARGLRLVSPSTGSIRTLPGTASYDVRDVVGDSTGALYAPTRNPDYLIKIVMTGGGDATVTKAVGTGTSGYNGNTTRFGSLAPGTAVQISQPQGLSLGLDGNVIFAEAGNSMIRAYEPRTGHVTDVLGGLVSPGGVPQAGFNGDGHYGDQTKLDRPLDVASPRLTPTWSPTPETTGSANSAPAPSTRTRSAE